jgi:hypothetical protein
VTVRAGPVWAAAQPGFDDDRIATATLLEPLDEGSGRYRG